MTDTVPKGELPEPPEKLRDRARASAEELQRVAVAIPSAALGVFFLALTQGINPPLTAAERVLLLTAIVTMAISVAAAVLTWVADAQWNQHLAAAKESADSAEQAQRRRSASRWQGFDAGAGYVFLIAFALGLIVTTAYVWLRAK